MAKSKNHTAHNQSYKAHKGGIKKVKAHKYASTRGVSTACSELSKIRTFHGCTDLSCCCLLQMDPKFLRNQVNVANFVVTGYLLLPVAAFVDLLMLIVQRYAKKKNPGGKHGSSGTV